MKNKIIVILFIFVLIFNVGCSESIHNTSDNTDSDIISILQTEHYINNTSIQSMFETTPEHINHTLENHLIIDAKVQVPDRDQVRSHHARLIDFNDHTDELIQHLFRGNTPKLVDEIMHEVQGEISMFRNYDYNDKSLNVQKGRMRFSSDESRLLDTILSTVYSLHDGYDEFFNQDNDLDFASRAEAAKNVTDFLTSLSIPVNENPEIFVMDYASLNRAQEDLLYQIPQEHFSGINFKDAFTKEDEFYLLHFRMQFDDIDLADEDWTDEVSQRFMPASKIEVIYSKNCIIGCQISGAYMLISSTDNDHLITVYEGIEAIHNKFHNLIITQDIVVTNICFEYVPTIIPGKFYEANFVPVWNFTVNTTVIIIGREHEADIERIQTTSIRINAITGEEIQKEM